MKTFNTDIIRGFKQFEAVRSEGRFNMYDVNARILTGLSEKQYVFIMENYSEIKEFIEKEKES